MLRPGSRGPCATYAATDQEVRIVTLLLPQYPGSRRVVPQWVTTAEVDNLRRLLHQDEFWVVRARWDRWLRLGERRDTVAIDELPRDDRLAALAWLRQQRHVLHDTVVGGKPAPAGWLSGLPLWQGMTR